MSRIILLTQLIERMVRMNRSVSGINVGNYTIGKVRKERVDPNAGKEMNSYYRDVMRKAFLEYMASPEWARVRMNVLVRDRKQCQRKWSGCYGQGNIVHHLNYDNWGKGNVEEVMDCLLVCSPCHEKEHADGRIAVPFFAKQNYRSEFREGEVYG